MTRSEASITPAPSLETSDQHPIAPPEVELTEISRRFELSRSAEECVALAHTADSLGASSVAYAALEKAVGLDRRCQSALLALAAATLDQGDRTTTYALLEEAHRIAPLTGDFNAVREELAAIASDHPGLDFYLQAIGRKGVSRAASPLSIVLVTNLFPPCELGGYGRMMWEFAHGLLARGHRVRVLTANVAEFTRTATPEEEAMETHVLRTLELAGTWVGGRPVLLTDKREVTRRVRDNVARLRTAIGKQHADLVLVGNLDFLGLQLLRPALEAETPILHALANARPGYEVAEQPTGSNYWVAPCSDWNCAVFTDAGYRPKAVRTLYPGARVDRFFHLIVPETSYLRICYASLVLPYKGAHTLVAALVELHRLGIDFTAEIGGDAPDAEFLARLQQIVRDAGMEQKVRFTGFLDRQELGALFARSNVLVFPSEFKEPFGISQVEALAAGLVVVTTGTGGAAEIVRDGVDGLLFSPGNAAELAARLRMLVGDPATMKRIQSAAQARSVCFSVNTAVERIEQLHEEIRLSIDASHAEDLPALPWS